jgi:hypothetical protein
MENAEGFHLLFSQNVNHGRIGGGGGAGAGLSRCFISKTAQHILMELGLKIIHGHKLNEEISSLGCYITRYFVTEIDHLLFYDSVLGT